MNPFAFLAPYKMLIEVLVIGSLMAGIAYAGHRFLEHEQQIGYDRRVAEEMAADEKARAEKDAKELAWKKQLEDSNNEKERLLEQNRNLSVAVAGLSSGLRNTTTDIDKRLSAASADAARNAARAYAALFTDCQGAYAAMGEAAAGHQSDVKSLMTAWPK